jgi:hypothetical protein
MLMRLFPGRLLPSQVKSTPLHRIVPMTAQTMFLSYHQQPHETCIVMLASRGLETNRAG